MAMPIAPNLSIRPHICAPWTTAWTLEHGVAEDHGHALRRGVRRLRVRSRRDPVQHLLALPGAERYAVGRRLKAIQALAEDGVLDADHPVPCLVAADRHAVAGGLRLLASGDSDLHCGGADTGEPLPAFLRREPLLDTTAGIVAHGKHPLLDGRPAVGNLSRYPWIDFDAAAPAAPNRVGQTTLDRLLGQLFRQTGKRATTILRASAASLFLMASGTWLAPASFRKSQCLQYSSCDLPVTPCPIAPQFAGLKIRCCR